MKEDGHDEQEMGQPKPRKKMVACKRVETRKGAVVVQYAEGGRQKRVVLPEGAFSERLPLDMLTQGIPLGIDWAGALKPSVTGQMLEDTLHNHGIWTKNDWRTRPRQVMSALQILTSDVLEQMRQAMQHYGGE